MAKGLKTGGRQTGTPNRLTSELRTILKEYIFVELQKLPDYLAELPTKDRIEILLKLCSFVLPKVEPVKFDKGEPVDSKDWWTR